MCSNCFKTLILALWTILVDTYWPHVCDMTKYILGACKFVSQVISPQISCPEIQKSSRGSKIQYSRLQYKNEITTFKYTYTSRGEHPRFRTSNNPKYSKHFLYDRTVLLEVSCKLNYNELCTVLVCVLWFDEKETLKSWMIFRYWAWS